MIKHLALASLAAIALITSPIAYAAEPVPGDSCTGGEENYFQRTGGNEIPTGHLIVCKSGTWRSILSWDAAAAITKIGNLTCTNGQILKFNGTTWGCATDSGGTLPALTSANIWVGNGSNAAIAVTMSGDATLSNSGVLNIANNAIIGPEISAGSVTNAHLAGSIALSKIAIAGTADGTKFLRDDGTWQTVPSSADNLGNHTASTTLNLNSNAISGVTTVAATGKISTAGVIKVGTQVACAAGDTGAMRYVGGSAPWEYCDGGGTWLPFRQPACGDNSTAGCYVEINRAISDPEFISANIASGVNILGVTGSLTGGGAAPDCTDDSASACTLGATRTTSDPDFIAANIFCGVNLLGIVGTYGGDLTPNIFNFSDANDVLPSTLTTSNIIQISGSSPNCPVSVQLSGAGNPQYRVCSNAICSGGNILMDWGSSNGTIVSGNYVQVRLTSSSDYYTARAATLSVGTRNDIWYVTTEAHTNLFARGRNNMFQLGDGTDNSNYGLPGPVMGGFSNWSAVASSHYHSAAGGHSCGIRSGALYCWGGNSDGRTGLGTSVGYQATPAQVGSMTGWTSVEAGEQHSCGIRSGALYCWGGNSAGRTGLGTTSGNQLTPAQLGTDADWTDVSLGLNHTCGIRSGQLYCWGSKANGRTGLGGITGNQTTPAQVGSDTGWSQVALGNGFSCGIRSGALYCWGNNANGQTGLGTTTGNQETPAQVGSSTNWVLLDGSQNHICGIQSPGTLHCWGANAQGATGLGTMSGAQTTPAQVGSDTNWSLVSAGQHTSDGESCGIRGGQLYCWNGDTGGTPTQVGGNTDWVAVSAGAQHILAVRAPF